MVKRMPPDFYVSQPYRLRRTEFIWGVAEAYLRTYWYFIVGVPIAGLMLLVAIPRREIELIAGLMILWPMSIPARAVLFSSKTWKRLSQETVARIGENEAFIEAGEFKPVRVPYTWVRRVLKTATLYILQGPRGASTFIRADAFSSEDRAEIETIFRDQNLLRRGIF